MKNTQVSEFIGIQLELNKPYSKSIPFFLLAAAVCVYEKKSAEELGKRSKLLPTVKYTSTVPAFLKVGFELKPISKRRSSLQR